MPTTRTLRLRGGTCNCQQGALVAAGPAERLADEAMGRVLARVRLFNLFLDDAADQLAAIQQDRHLLEALLEHYEAQANLVAFTLEEVRRALHRKQLVATLPPGAHLPPDVD